MLKDKSAFKLFITLAIPIFFQNLINFSISTLGNMMVSSLGTEAISSVFVANQVQVVIQFINVGIEAGLLVCSAKALGGGSSRSAFSYLKIALLLSLLASILIFLPSFFAPKAVLSLFSKNKTVSADAAEYLRLLAISFIPFCISQSLIAFFRSAKKTGVGFVSSIFALIMNLLLNYLLIFGNLTFPKLGIKGAGISSIFARFAELAVVFIYSVCTHKKRKDKAKTSINKYKIFNFLSKTKELFHINKEDLKCFFATSYPLILSQLVWCVNTFFYTYILSLQQAPSVMASAASALAYYNLAYIISGALTASLGVITARSLGEGNTKQVKEFSSSAGIFFIVIGIASAVLMQVGKNLFMWFWNVNSESAIMTNDFINIMSIMIIFTSYQSALLNGIIKSSGETKFILKLESFSVFMFIIPLTSLFNAISADTRLIFSLLKCDQVIKSAVVFFKIRKLKFTQPKHKKQIE